MDGLGEHHDAGLDSTPVWAVFGDLMAGLLGAFVLLLVCVIGVQLELANQLQTEVQQRQAEQRRQTFEQTLAQALAGPLARPGDAGQRPHRHQRQCAVCAEL